MMKWAVIAVGESATGSDATRDRERDGEGDGHDADNDAGGEICSNCARVYPLSVETSFGTSIRAVVEQLARLHGPHQHIHGQPYGAGCRDQNDHDEQHADRHRPLHRVPRHTRPPRDDDDQEDDSKDELAHQKPKNIAPEK